METVVTVAVVIAVIAAGMFVIHRLNEQHAERIGAFRYSDALPGVGRRLQKGARATAPEGSPADTTRREHRERTAEGAGLLPAGAMGMRRRPSPPPTHRP
ncbi:hypothetical protein [Streptomyces sp. TRM64462]|uniref:hypothetical protein n=1 Tax=Streptomyces sp. TRM64462 TaxID=2741726 RepID=UPI00158621A9|nr:hypothetical protein [Streptomyces sp. TRM64462]